MERSGEQGERKIAVVGILIRGRTEAAGRVNTILGRHAGMILGRMGIPRVESGEDVAVIALIVEGTNAEIGALTGKLGNIPGVKVKAAVTT